MMKEEAFRTIFHAAFYLFVFSSRFFLSERRSLFAL